MSSITCPKCGMTSCNTGDIKHRYCGRCHQFYDQMVEIPTAIRSPRADKLRQQVSAFVKRAMGPRRR